MMERLLAWLVGADLAQSIWGDLAEQRAQRARRSRAAAAMWFAGASAAIVLRVITTKIGMALVSAGRTMTVAGGALDARAAARSLTRAPGYALTATGVLAVSLTLAVLVFAVVDGVLLRPLPYPQSDRLAAIQPGWTSRAFVPGAVSASPSDFMAWRTIAPDVRFAAFSLGGAEQIDEGDRALSADVGAGFLEVLGQLPILGGFAPEHFISRQPIRPALLTHAAWRRRFGGDPSVVGRVLHGDGGRSVQVVGILQESFLFPTALGRLVPEVLTPLVMGPDAAEDRGRGLHVIARVPAGIGWAELEARLHTATVDVAGRFPKRPNQGGAGPFDLVRVAPLDSALRAPVRTTFTVVFSLAAALVLLACVNVTGLAAARAQDRWRELALRRALGAGGGDLIRLLLIENAILVAAGAAIGVAASTLLLPSVTRLLPVELALLKPLTIDLRVVGFALVAAVACVGVTAFWPARAILKGRLRAALADGAAATTRRGGVGRRILVAMQVAIALAMAVGGALLVGSWTRVWQQNTGYRVGSTVHLSIAARSPVSWTDIDGLLQTLRRAPGVRAAGAADIWLLQRAVRGSSFEPPAGVKETSNTESFGVTAGFLETTGLAPIDGRWPSDAELASGAAVAVVSQRIAREYWPGQPAVGRSLFREGRPFGIVGVVPDARYLSLDLEPDGAIYYPLSAHERPSIASVFLTFDGRAAGRLTDVVAAINAQHPVFRVRRAQPLTHTLADSVRGRTFQAVLFGMFGVAGVLVAGAGILSLAAILASQRTREVGLRMALGARPPQIARLMVRQHLGGAWIGLLAGALLAAGVARSVDRLLYKSSGFDPLAWTVAVLIVLTMIAIGALIPAVRASRVDPVRALKD